MMTPRQWFEQHWPRQERRTEVARQWVALGQLKLVLTDIALRGGVYRGFGAEATDVYSAGRLEGRRELALEVIKLASAHPEVLFALVEKKEPA